MEKLSLKEIGQNIIRIVYNDFKSYFDKGIIVVSGSHYYKKIGFRGETEYKDIDLIVDERKEFDYIINEIFEFYGSKGFIGIDHGKLSASVDIMTSDRELAVDLLRNDHSDILPPFEIIPGVFTYRQSDKTMLKVYEKYTKISCYVQKNYDLADFFKQRCPLPNKTVQI